MNRKNCVSGIFWTLFFLFFLYLDVQMGENASYWPGIIAKLGIALSLLSTLVSGMKWKSEKDEKLFPFTGAQLNRLGIALALLIIWVVCIRILGFLTSSVIVMAATGLIFELALSSKTGAYTGRRSSRRSRPGSHSPAHRRGASSRAPRA